MQKLRGQGAVHLAVFDEVQFQTDPVLKAAMPWGGQTMITVWFLSSVSSDPNAPAAQYMNRRWEDRPNEYVFRRLVYDNGGQIVQSDTGTAYGIVESYKRQIQLALRYGQTKFGGNIVDGTIDTLWYKRPADHDKKLIDELRFAKEYKRTEEYMAIANLPPHQDEASFKFIKNAMGKEEFDAEIMSKTSNGDAEAGISHALNVESVGILKERMRARANDPGFARVLQQFNYTYSGLGTLWKDTRVHVLVLHDPANGGKDSDPILMTLCPVMAATDLQKQEIQRKRAIQTARSLCHPLDGINVLVRTSFNSIISIRVYVVHEKRFELHCTQKSARVLPLPGTAHIRHACISDSIRREHLKRRDRRTRHGHVVKSRKSQQQSTAQNGTHPCYTERQPHYIVGVGNEERIVDGDTKKVF